MSTVPSANGSKVVWGGRVAGHDARVVVNSRDSSGGAPCISAQTAAGFDTCGNRAWVDDDALGVAPVVSAAVRGLVAGDRLSLLLLGEVVKVAYANKSFLSDLDRTLLAEVEALGTCPSTPGLIPSPRVIATDLVLKSGSSILLSERSGWATFPDGKTRAVNCTRAVREGDVAIVEIAFFDDITFDWVQAEVEVNLPASIPALFVPINFNKRTFEEAIRADGWNLVKVTTP